MRFIPTTSEIAKSVTHLDGTPSDLTNQDLFISGSQWNGKHLRALRVVLLEPLLPHRLIPAEFLPIDGNPVCAELEPQLRQASIDDLKGFLTTASSLKKNPFFGVFKHLSNCMTTRPSHVEGTTDYIRNPTPESESSASSAEDKDEEPSRLTFPPLVDTILLHENFDFFRSGTYTYGIRSDEISRTVRIWLGERATPVTAKNDGSLYILREGTWTASTRYGVVPVASFEAKRRDAAGVHRKSGEKEKYCADILGQEVAEMLGQAMENSRQLSEDDWHDQESFVVNVHGTHLKLTVTRFSREYLRAVNSKIMPTDEILWVRRSKPLDLKIPDQRAEAFQLLVGLCDLPL